MSISVLQSLNVGPGLIAVRPVGGNLPGTIIPFEFEGLQSASFDIDQKIVSAMGQFKMAFDSAPVDMTVKGTVEVLQLSGVNFMNLISSDSATVGGNMNSYREPYTLAAVAVGTWTTGMTATKGMVITDGTNLQICTVAGTAGSPTPTWATNAFLGGVTTDGSTVKWVCAGIDTGAPSHVCAVNVTQAQYFAEDGNVMYASTNDQLVTLGGAQGLVALPAPPAVGQYTCVGTSGWYLFNATDSAQVIFISYQYTSATANNTYPINNHWIGWGPIVEMNMQFPYQAASQSTITCALHLVAVRFGNMKTKTKRDGYTTVTYDWEAFCPPNGIAGQFYLPN
jgi:hypothetical protein